MNLKQDLARIEWNEEYARKWNYELNSDEKSESFMSSDFFSQFDATQAKSALANTKGI